MEGVRAGRGGGDTGLLRQSRERGRALIGGRRVSRSQMGGGKTPKVGRGGVGVALEALTLEPAEDAAR